MAIDKFNLNQQIQDFLKSKNINSFTEVQNSVIPLLLSNKQVLVKSPTGSGKTFAFLLPLIQKINTEIDKPQLVIFLPTRELSFQIEKEIKELNKFLNPKISYISMFGGKEKSIEEEKFSKKQIIIATPTRFEIIFNNNPTSLKEVKNIVLDEIDMLDNFGFLETFNQLYKNIFTSKPNISVFSATLNNELVRKIKAIFNSEFKTISLEVTKEININVIATNDRNKDELLVSLLKQDWLNPFLAIIFVNKNTDVDKYFNILKKQNFDNLRKFNNSLTQRERKRLINDLKNNNVVYLITTDLMSRGMDFEGVSHIINLDMPFDNQYFIHRIGRTNRSNDQLGKIYSITDDSDYKKLLEFSKKHKINLKKIKI